MSVKAISQYLDRYAELEASVVRGNTALGLGPWEVALVVPACGEAPGLLRGFESACSHAPGRVLIVLVVNAGPDATSQVIEANLQLCRALGQGAERVVTLHDAPPMTLCRLAWADVLLIERWEPPWTVPVKQGVGLARKLGSDVALALWRDGQLAQPWLCQTDCDVRLPEDYFRRLPAAGDGAVVFPFRHVASGDTDVAQATFQVEAKLRYHVLGLQWANARSAWHSLGSCLAFAAPSYAVVRGFPKRAAGEDFHVLDKLNKVCTVAHDWGQPLQILARRSARTPVGTGSAVEQLLSVPGQRLDAPACYAALKNWMARLDAFIDSRDATWLDGAARGGLSALPSAVVRHLELAETASALTSFVGQTKHRADLARRVHAWFGGLECWRLIHAAAADTPPVEARNALCLAPFTRELASTEGSGAVDWQAWCERLAELERQRFAQSRGSRAPSCRSPG